MRALLQLKLKYKETGTIKHKEQEEEKIILTPRTIKDAQDNVSNNSMDLAEDEEVRDPKEMK